MNTTLPLRAVAPDVCVAPQLTPEAMAEAARAGFRSVVNNRPAQNLEENSKSVLKLL